MQVDARRVSSAVIFAVMIFSYARSYRSDPAIPSGPGSPSGPPADRDLSGNTTSSSVSYFGCGCFWHVQHAMISGAEEPVLGRSGTAVTAFAGYAGGSGSDAGRVCYHNYEGVGDYGTMGYAEVVSMELPEGDVTAVADFFFNSVCVKGIRKDRQDSGTEYRSLVGFPGGIESPMGRAFKEIGEGHGANVIAGVGGDADISGTVYVMDSIEFPFHQGEVYHQFHDDMIESYSSEYHSVRDSLLSNGALRHTGCPSDSVEDVAAS